ncbi:Os02g0611250 [Oryza sativa Japonica Group]|uniref:Os02g0611250 protein n=1 Tax=Oryza sativa subsp. japonica TaxID=39947 RepID=A0A0P0VLR0_ORYSJ|nr:hypothetical protein EE612_012348 [Oryza sativa]BAS79718.1 Os02g0611250 [Oryza sativa Japonica Group]
MQNRSWRPGGDFSSSSEALVNEQTPRRQLLLNHVAARIGPDIQPLGPGPCMVAATKDGNRNRELQRAKASQHPLDKVTIGKGSRVEAHDLVAGIAEAILRSHMNG